MKQSDAILIQRDRDMWKQRALIAEAKCATMRDPEWPKIRKAHLKKESSCQACGGILNLEVHHIMPFHLDKAREMDDTNLMTLCEAVGLNCHFIIGHKRDWKSYNPLVRADALRALKLKGLK